ncbi:LolA family protein [Maribellus mangrovi]|uniref:LolA family protein n=1 Tax=Maribellus mangrovi TaxID=3133146 RepID=UPI0030EB6C82
MKRTFILTALVLFAFVAAQAQTLDEVLEKHYKAAGQDKIAAVKTFYVKAKLSMMGMEMPMTMQMKKPNKFRIDTEAMGQKIVQGYDGENGWMINPMVGGGVTDLKGAELKQAMNQADLEGELYNYKEKGHSAELIGKVNADGEEAYRIKFTNADGTVKDYYIDANSYLISKVKAKVEQMGQSMNIETKITEYKDINGIKIGSKMEIETPMGTQSMVMEEIKLDEAIDDTVFARPAE